LNDRLTVVQCRVGRGSYAQK